MKYHYVINVFDYRSGRKIMLDDINIKGTRKQITEKGAELSYPNRIVTFKCTDIDNIIRFKNGKIWK